jgi:SAM-dependent methyltransferase
MNDYSAYRSAELAELYDAVYANSADIAFWQVMAASASDALLELGCGTGRVLLPLARDGHAITGLDLATPMLARCRVHLQAEPPEVRDRVTLLEADMTSFNLDRRFAQIYCAFGTFHHLRTVEQQLACLERCRQHLLPNGTLILDLINPDPAPGSVNSDVPADADTPAGVVDWTNGRRIRSWATMLDYHRLLQCNDCEVTYEIIEADGTTRRLTETFPMRLLYRYELEHLLARCGFRIVALYGDYDYSAFSDESLGMIVVAERINYDALTWTLTHQDVTSHQDQASLLKSVLTGPATSSPIALAYHHSPRDSDVAAQTPGVCAPRLSSRLPATCSPVAAIRTFRRGRMCCNSTPFSQDCGRP